MDNYGTVDNPAWITTVFCALMVVGEFVGMIVAPAVDGVVCLVSLNFAKPDNAPCRPSHGEWVVRPSEEDSISKVCAISFGRDPHAIDCIVAVQTDFVAEFGVEGLLPDPFERFSDSVTLPVLLLHKVAPCTKALRWGSRWTWLQSWCMTRSSFQWIARNPHHASSGWSRTVFLRGVGAILEDANQL